MLLKGSTYLFYKVQPLVRRKANKKAIVYYESIKRELKVRPINECRCDERLKTKVEESTHLEEGRAPIFFFLP